MVVKNVADMPWVAQLNETASGAVARISKVPLRYWRMGVIAIALVWIVHTLAHLVWVVIPAPKMPDAPVVATTVTKTSSSTVVNVDVDKVVDAHLFGKYVAPTAVAAVEAPKVDVEQPLPTTSLDVTLEGVIAANEPEFSSAIIARNSKQTIYKVGEELDGLSNVTVENIEPLRVVLSNRGKLEELWLYGEDGKKFATSRASYTPPSRSTPAPAAESRASFSRDQVSDVKTISDVVRFMVATENGQMVGYKVRPGRKRELFEQAGLKTNDIVVSVNGIQVNEPQKVREVYQALKNATEANLEVLRDGVTQTIQISMSSEG